MPKASDDAILERVLEFDGKTTGSLESACRSAGKDFTGFDQLLELAASADTRMQIGATWAIRKLLELGADMSAEELERFTETAAAQTAWEAQLHIAQSIQFLESANLNTGALAKTLHPWCDAKRPFLRAWAIDAICQLAQRDPSLNETAMELLTKGEQDAAASVRARVRNLRKEIEPQA